MNDNERWFAATFIGLFLSISTMIIAKFSSISSKIGGVHERVERVKDDYVRRDDMRVSMDRLERAIEKRFDQIAKEQQEMHRMIMELLAK